MDAEDRTALIALYKGTGGDAWLQNTGWCTDAPLLQWHGVSVDEEGHVVRLDLTYNNLEGEIPRELGSLHNLRQLLLNGNKLTGEIPRELGSLHKLEYLNLRMNKLTGEIPRELGSLHNLKYLHLDGNKLTGEIPRELGSLHKLEFLNLRMNKLTGEIPRELGSLHKLKYLHLQGNELTGEIPRELGSLHKLEYLNLRMNKLTGEIPRELGSLHKLEYLNLRMNKLTGAVPAQLVQLYHLLYLDLDGNNFSGPLPSLKQLKDIFDALAGADSGNEEPPVYSDTTGLSGKGSTKKSESSANTALTASMTASSLSEPPVYFDTTDLSEKGLTKKAASSANTAVSASMRASLLPAARLSGYPWITEDQHQEEARKVTARVSDFKGDVMAWSFGSTSGVISCPDFELEISDLSRNVPALIGQSPSEVEIVDGEVCLLHPVVTCLAGSGEAFNPPLLLRFSVEDTMESGSDVGGSNEDDESFKADLRSRYSVVKREEGSSTWEPIEGEIKKMDNGVFVLEAQVSHFTDFTLKHKSLTSLASSLKAGEGQTEIFKVKKLPRNISLFVNKGAKTIIVVYWRHRTERNHISRAEASVGVAPVAVSAAIDRVNTDTPTDAVYSQVVPSDKAVALNISAIPSLEVAWATSEDNGDHRLMTVWGRSTLDEREAMVIGPLQERVYAVVQDLEIAKGEDICTKVRTSLGS